MTPCGPRTGEGKRNYAPDFCRIVEAIRARHEGETPAAGGEASTEVAARTPSPDGGTDRSTP